MLYTGPLLKLYSLEKLRANQLSGSEFQRHVKGPGVPGTPAGCVSDVAWSTGVPQRVVAWARAGPGRVPH